MIYGLQMGAVIVNKGFEQGLKDYEEIAKKAGLESIEIDFSHPALFTDGLKARVLLSEIGPELKKKIKSFVKPFKIKGGHLLWSSMGIFPVSENEIIQKASWQVIRESIKKAQELGLNYVTLHSAHPVKNMPEHTVREKFRKAVLDNADILDECKIVMAIENMGGDEAWLIETIRGMKNSHVRMTFDIGHYFNFEIASKKISLADSLPGLVSLIKSAEGIIRNVHMHDHSGQSDHLPIGKGVVDFKPIIQAFRSINYPGPINLEFATNNLQDAIESIRILKEYERFMSG